MNIKPTAMLLTMLAGGINRQQSEIIEYLKEENSILREELLKATKKKRIILNNIQRRRLAILGKKLGRKILGEVCFSFSPDTVLMWHRKLVAKKYDGSVHRSKFGRPRISDETKQRIIDIAKNNKHLGVRKFFGYMKYLGIKVSPSSISRILKEHDQWNAGNVRRETENERFHASIMCWLAYTCPANFVKLSILCTCERVNRAKY
jgi:putative transposase